jgi:anaerobic dimethyl sulfoxide reductase subunit C (anchor subunit)
MRRHEGSLVAFTLLAQTAAGLALFLLAPLYLLPDFAMAPRLRTMKLGACVLVLVLIGAAALLSLLHLKRRGRAPRALANAGTSWLSKEILALVLFGAATAGQAFLAWRAPVSPAAVTLVILVAAEAVALVYSMSRLYTLPAVPDWNTPATAAAFFGTAALLGSMLAALAARGEHALVESASGQRFAGALSKLSLAVAGIVFVTALLYSPGLGLIFKRPGARVYEPDPRLGPVFGVRMALLLAALVLWGLAIYRPSAPAWLGWAGFAAAFLSETIGRRLFYALPDEL